jgi:hypothetical protein
LVAAATDAAGISIVSRDISQLTLLQHLSEVMPAADLLLGGAMLILIMLAHAAGVRATSNHVLHRSSALLARPTRSEPHGEGTQSATGQVAASAWLFSATAFMQ